MKIRELPGNINIQDIKVKLPSDVYEDSKIAGLSTDEVYLVGFLMGYFFVKIDDSTKIYPLFEKEHTLSVSRLLDFDIINQPVLINKYIIIMTDNELVKGKLYVCPQHPGVLLQFAGLRPDDDVILHRWFRPINKAAKTNLYLRDNGLAVMGRVNDIEEA